MDPGDYRTNVVSLNNFARINYEYYEIQTSPSGSARRLLQNSEIIWRREGRLAHCETASEGIWVFHNTSTTLQSTGSFSGTESSPRSNGMPMDGKVVDINGVRLVVKEQGVFEPLLLARSKQGTLSVLNSASSTTSPSSSLETPGRSASALNSRSVQANSLQAPSQEPSINSPGHKPFIRLDEPWPSMKDVHDRFISAVLGSLMSVLCRDEGFIPLSPRTLILNRYKASNSEGWSSKPTFGNSITLATLDVSLTSLGTLVIKAFTDMAPRLQSPTSSSVSSRQSSRLLPGSPLWLAPAGNSAKFHSMPDTRGLPRMQFTADSKIGSISEETVKAWQSKCLEWLKMRGIDSTIVETGGWLFVQMLGGNFSYPNSDYQATPMFDGRSIVPWPAHLCFQNYVSPTSASAFEQPKSWGRDPLAFAEDWFMGQAERTNLILKRKKDRQIADALTKEQAEVTARALQTSTNSPAILRRGSNAGAMYPTPPDAIQNTNGTTPAFDGVGSTPGNPNPFPAPDGTTIGATAIGFDNETDIWPPSDKRERTVNTTSNDNYNEIELFGDPLGGDFFKNDITDDDFSFFDKPDVIKPEPKADSPNDLSKMDIEEAVTVQKPPATNRASGMQPPATTSIRSRDTLQQPNNGMPASSLKIVARVSTDPEEKPLLQSQQGPFDPQSIFQRLVKQTNRHNTDGQSRRTSLFNEVKFENSLSLVDAKYRTHGRYRFTEDRRRLKPSEDGGPPRTKCLKARRKAHISVKAPINFARIWPEKKPAEQPDIVEPMDFFLDTDGESQISEHDDTSHTTEEASAIHTLGFDKGWMSDNGQGDITPQVAKYELTAIDFDQPENSPRSARGTQNTALDGDFADWSRITYPSSPEPEALINMLSDLETVAIAQILVDQIVSGTLELPLLSDSESLLNKTVAKGSLVRSTSKAVRTFFKDFTSCTLRSFCEIPGIPVLNQGLRLPPRPINQRTGSTAELARANNPFPINPPQLELRRSDSKLSVLPSAVNFWENLGLGPSGGNKDIQSVCVYPNIEGVRSSAAGFLKQIGTTYESFRLGSHEALKSKDLDKGTIPFPLDSDNQSPAYNFHNMANLRETASRLSQILASTIVEDNNFVVYFVYPRDDSSLLIHICHAFQCLFELYRKSLVERKPKMFNELVLQLIPLDLISSPTTIPIPSPTEYSQLALEVYSRCMDFSSSTSNPAIMLERPLPRTIDFKLNPTPSASLLQENTCLHIAYASSSDDRWITAVWTDNRGTNQMTASYCLGRKNEPISMPFSQVATEIWETTLDFISSKKIHWRILITKVGIMDCPEVEIWTELASRGSNAQVNLTLITVQTEPSLRLIPPAISIGAARDGTQITTPVLTPQNSAGSVLSPETSTTPTQTIATPSDQTSVLDPDPSTRLLSLVDQTHGLVLSHRLSNSRSLVNPNPALMSGYLIKYSTPTPVLIEVNIIHSEVAGNPRTYYEALMRELLVNYAGLGTLSRTRGTTGPLDARPWHIAAAEKAVKVLHTLM
ncbi:mediator complex subunit 13 C-terminal-domain-containing protein [Amylocarpus encephaloides]|uniref:Mediator of RNA polymerase II transcription subunit 13 n=1 Tax=Amylocarpus encephaloides TaxID=45428 RepID=A0A9P7YG09_9HELO|nr:mediator complex subunit 13 C-terminal-domain-containing protein [Amylocarpus encephaloides]